MDNVKWDAPELARRYDAVSDSQYERGLILMDKMKIIEGSAVLDIGCGTGRMALHVAGMVGPSGMVFGINPSSHRIRVAMISLGMGLFITCGSYKAMARTWALFPTVHLTMPICARSSTG